MKDIAKYSVRAIYILESYIIPFNEKTILFESSSGRNYAGSPRYIYEEMVSQGLDEEYKCVWSLSNTDIEIPGNAIKSVGKYHATVRLYEAATAEIKIEVVSQEEAAQVAETAAKEKEAEPAAESAEA